MSVTQPCHAGGMHTRRQRPQDFRAESNQIQTFSAGPLMRFDDSTASASPKYMASNSVR